MFQRFSWHSGDFGDNLGNFRGLSREVPEDFKGVLKEIAKWFPYFRGISSQYREVPEGLQSVS